MVNIAINNGLVVDGEGSPAYPGTVLVEGGRIAAVVGPDESVAADMVIDAEGHVVAPGFIDMHSHSDIALLVDPAAQSALRQGITTQVTGLCGFSPAPIPAEGPDALRSACSVIDYPCEWGWKNFPAYLVHFHNLSINIVPLAGHVPLRGRFVGFDDSPIDDAALREMQQELAHMLDNGAWGLSLGLMFPPSMYAERRELVALAQTTSDHGGLLAVHIRSYGTEIAAAVDEVLEISAQTGVALQISHLRFSGATTAQAPEIFAKLENAARHRQTAFDIYPYTAGSANLSQLLPGWAQAGGSDAMRQRLHSPDVRRQAAADMQQQLQSDYIRDFGSNVLLGDASGEFREHIGRSVQAIAKDRSIDPYTAFFDILTAEGTDAIMVAFTSTDEQVQLSVDHPLSVIGSDGAAIAIDGPLSRGMPHPRYFGAYPRLLRRAREENQPLEPLIHKMTARPASLLGLSQRGRLAPGCAADIVVFDPETITDTATYEQPHQYPEGIATVLVNGAVELSVGRHQHAGAGTVLRR